MTRLNRDAGASEFVLHIQPCRWDGCYPTEVTTSTFCLPRKYNEASKRLQPFIAILCSLVES